jgi:hypothetical protein
VGADGFFSHRDVYLKGWSGLDSAEAVKLAAEVLQDAGWVRRVRAESSDPLGRGPANRYEVNPAVGNEHARNSTRRPEADRRDWKPNARILADLAGDEP